ncbi:cupin domain-containing protein [Paenibacillus kobensis]|uniref:cupin domain-containing protein n=1 Tax=Paenibacillus kobensis TaxID=59841 RepID=UPI000FD8C61B|nr:cupin domain-containing protein [Paenibacillus kobensis]
MYSNASYHHHWHNPMHRHWNYNWSYDRNPYYHKWHNHHNHHPHGNIFLQDHGTKPFVVNINQAAKQNNNYRTALWTGKNLQVTLMSIKVGEDIGLEVHPATDQFIRIEEGQGFVQMGNSKDNLNFQAMAYDGYAIMIPAGTWHNVTNAGYRPLKVYSIYAPPQHPFGTVHETKAIAQQQGD